MLADSRVGAVLASKYRLEELLGSGGMGHVYRAVNVEIERAVAIKVLRSEHATNPQIVERFLREARAANMVRHPNVVDVVDIGRDGDGSPFIVQELLRGEDLGKFVERRGGQLTLAEVEEYLLPVIDAVAEAHAQGVVHRDIKPENVFLADQGRRRVPKLLDFGISKMRLTNIKLTDVGMMMGTPAYMAPEQVQGAHDADPRADVWALGVMLFELIAGRLPFDVVDAPALFLAIATKDVPRLVDVCPDVAGDLSKIVERCLRRSPDDRYPTALELSRDMRRFYDGEEPEPTNRNVRLDAIPELRVPKKGALDIALSKTDLGPLPERPARATVREVPQLRPQSSPEIARSGLVIDLPPEPSERPISLAPSKPDASAARSPARPPPPSPRRQGPPEPLPGVMLAGPPSTPRRREPIANAVPRHAPASTGADVSFLVALAVVAITTIATMSVLTTVATRPDGWPIVALVTKPTPSLRFIGQGAFGACALFFAVRAAREAIHRWRTDVPGSRGAALVSAIIAGALFFAALQLTRAAW